MKLLKQLAVPLIALFLLFGIAKATTILFPSQGGTGTGTIPNTGGKVLISTNGGVYTPAYLTAGTGISIASASGSITLSATAMSFPGILFNVFGGTAVHVGSISFDPGGFNVSTTASTGKVFIDYTNGPASRSLAQTWTQLQTFNGSPLGFSVANSASISSNLEVSGYASASFFKGSAFPSTNCSGSQFLQWATTGLFTCATPTGNSYNGLAMHEGTATAAHVTDLTYAPSGFNFSNVASAGTLALDYVNGPASRSIAQTISGKWTFTANASVSAANFGIRSGSVIDTTFEVGGTSSISGLARFGNSASISLNLEVGGYSSTSILFIGQNKQVQLSATQASLSIPFEDTSYVSSSFFKGSAFPSSNCTGQTALQWSTTGVFNCSGSFQTQNSSLTALAALGGNGIVVQTGANTFTNRTITGTANQITLVNGDGVSGNPTISIPVLFSITTASLSSNLEVGGYASASFFKGSAFPSTNCTTTNSFLQWATTGLFSCSASTAMTAQPGIAAGQVQFFQSSTVSSGSSNLFWDTTNQRLGVGTTSPTSNLEVQGTQADYKANWSDKTKFGRVLFAENGANIMTFQAIGAQFATVNRQHSMEYINTTASGSQTWWTANTERMRLNSSGNLGIGTTAPTAKFDLRGEGYVKDSGAGVSASSSFTVFSTLTTGSAASISATSLTAGGSALQITVIASTSTKLPHGVLLVRDAGGTALASLSNAGSLALRGYISSHGSLLTCTVHTGQCLDYAEAYPTKDTTLQAGEVVAMGADGYVVRANEQDAIIGVISTNPAIVIDGNATLTGSEITPQPGKVYVAMAGRVPVKVKGSVHLGDHLAVTNGEAINATSAGMTIGMALTNDENGYTTILVENTYWAPSFIASPHNWLYRMLLFFHLIGS